MKLTEKDKEFLERLRGLLEEKGVSIELKEDGIKRMVLRRNYGAKIAQVFGMTRQGVRWRFHRVFSDIYVSAYETILWVESHFGADLRDKAMQIARQRTEMRKRAQRDGQIFLPSRGRTR